MQKSQTRYFSDQDSIWSFKLPFPSTLYFAYISMNCNKFNKCDRVNNEACFFISFLVAFLMSGLVLCRDCMPQHNRNSAPSGNKKRFLRICLQPPAALVHVASCETQTLTKFISTPPARRCVDSGGKHLGP